MKIWIKKSEFTFHNAIVVRLNATVCEQLQMDVILVESRYYQYNVKMLYKLRSLVTSNCSIIDSTTYCLLSDKMHGQSLLQKFSYTQCFQIVAMVEWCYCCNWCDSHGGACCVEFSVVVAFCSCNQCEGHTGRQILQRLLSGHRHQGLQFIYFQPRKITACSSGEPFLLKSTIT